MVCEQTEDKQIELNNSWHSVVCINVKNMTNETICIRFEYENIYHEFHNAYKNFLNHTDKYQIVQPDAITIEVYEIFEGWVFGRTKELIYKYMINKCSDIETDL